MLLVQRLVRCSIASWLVLGTTTLLFVISVTALGKEYKIEIQRAGYLNLGPEFQYERGLRYEYRIALPKSDTPRNLWMLVDVDGKLSWTQHSANPGITTITVESRQRTSDGMSVGQHILKFTLFDERVPDSPPGYPSGKVSIPAGWTARATASISFTVHALEIPTTRRDGIWLSSTPPGAEVYLAPAVDVRRPDGGADLSKVLDPRYYVGAAPVFAPASAGDYVVAFLLPVNERVTLAPDYDFAQVLTTKDGRVVSVGRGYEVTREPGKLATCIGLFQLADKPLAEAFPWLPSASVYTFRSDSLRTALRTEGVDTKLIDQVITVLPKCGKVSLDLGTKILIVEVDAEGWSVTVLTRKASGKS